MNQPVTLGLAYLIALRTHMS